jgi:hypothetical protein
VNFEYLCKILERYGCVTGVRACEHMQVLEDLKDTILQAMGKV